ncbi:T9SS type A sorting domain-containing protein [Jejuia spongiicola]|uniref:T9SS type A sorting domain-containing protein n=1 Tax=Jejuia spongiicola TaxID=2942207 RepID=A0ABT0QC08_9FLAO|nr:T9SS type A sorting domain-containing protein [Jejuia spongiicola]MCL6294526.1 T9SS type A sorting domain-containing protein [Jejuia spongiicola]
MKRNLHFLLILLLSSTAIIKAQTLTYALEWNATENYYEVWATPNFSPNEMVHNTAGSRISIAVSALDAPRTFTHTSPSGITYTAEFFSIHKPGAAPTEEFFSWADNAGGTSIKTPFFTDGVPVLLLTFTLSDGKNDCIRLWDNTSDPEPTEADMAGRQFDNNFTSQAFPTFVGVERYDSNTPSTTFTFSCSTLSNTDITSLNAFRLYPNPAKDKVYIKGDISQLIGVEIYTMTGQLVKRLDENFETLDVSDLESAVYFVNLFSSNGQKTIRLVKE